MTSPPEPRWRLRVRLPHRLGPTDRTGVEIAAVAALIAAAFFLALAGVFGGDGNSLLVFPAFGIPDLLFAWFRWRRFRVAARWATDLRAAILLTVLTVYLAVSAFIKVHRTLPLIGVSVAVVLEAGAAAVWTTRVVRDRPR